MRNPNGYGSVTKMSGNRRRPYAVKKTIGFNAKGHPIYDVIGYTETREEGNILLGKYNNDPWDVDKAKITFQGLYDLWREKKWPKLSAASQGALGAAYKHCVAYADTPYKRIKAYHMQGTIDNCGRGASMQAHIKNLWNHLDAFAIELDLNPGRYADILKSDPMPETTRDRLSDAEIEAFWRVKSRPWVDSILIMIYSGWRISELLGMRTEDVDLTEGTMRGGLKTAAGKGRIVPIHSLIFDMIERRASEGNKYLLSSNGHRCPYTTYRHHWDEIVADLEIAKTPHSCRHTFESLLDAVGANRRCIDLMMGHKSKDVGNRIYNHKTIEDLKFSIELVTR